MESVTPAQTAKGGIEVRVLPSDIRGGECGDMHRCAVALALQRVVPEDSDPHVYERDYRLRIQVGAYSMVAPWEVREFVRNFDDVDRDDDDMPILPKKLPQGVRPFAFTLPPWDDDQWEEECHHCQELGAPARLNDEGYCPECVATETAHAD